MNITYNNINYHYTYETSQKKTTVILVHGICEHLQRYDNFRHFLNQQGFSTLQYDLYGHGQTEGERGNIKHFYRFIEELDFFVDYVKSQKPGDNVVLLGHSLGGLIVSLYSILHPEKIAGCILSGAPTRRLLKIWPLIFLPNKIVKRITFKTDYKYKLNNQLSTNETSNKAYHEDLLVLDNFRGELIKNMFFYGTNYLLKNIWRFTTPVLFLHGKDDPIVNHRHSIKTHNIIKSRQKELILFDGMKHELINETDNKLVYDTINTWLNKYYG